MTQIITPRVRSADYGEGRYEEFSEFPLAGITAPAALDAYPWPDAGRPVAI